MATSIVETEHETSPYKAVIEFRKKLADQICSELRVPQDKKEKLLSDGGRQHMNAVLERAQNPSNSLKAMIAVFSDVTDALIERNTNTNSIKKEVHSTQKWSFIKETTMYYDPNKQHEIDKKMANSCIESIKETKSGYSNKIDMLQIISDFLQNIAATLRLSQPAPDRKNAIEKMVEKEETNISDSLKTSLK